MAIVFDVYKHGMLTTMVQYKLHKTIRKFKTNAT